MAIRVGILTVSDRCARGEREDEGGPALAKAVGRLGWKVAACRVVPDDAAKISAGLRRWSAGPAAVDLLLTTGGTGLGPRDVTPEATRAVIEREAPGLAERVRREGELKTRLSALSRAVCGTRGKTLIVNLPGSPKGAVESLSALAELIPHAVKMMAGGGH